MPHWGRLLTAIITPYDSYGNVDYKKAASLAEKLIANGSDGVVVAGTTGESPVLSTDEKENLYAAIKEKLGNTGLVLAATGTNDTRTTIAATQRAAAIGLDGVMVVVPYYNKPSQEGLYQHFRNTATSTDLPIMAYNIPSRTGTALSNDTIIRLSEIPTIKAVKVATGNVLDISHLRQSTANHLLLYSGDDNLTLPFLALGAHGVVSVASHVAGRALKQMIQLFTEGQPEEALAMHEKLLPLFEEMFIDVNPVPVKAMLDFLGFLTGGYRLPLVMPNESIQEHITKMLRNFDAQQLLDYPFPKRFAHQ